VQRPKTTLRKCLVLDGGTVSRGKPKGEKKKERRKGKSKKRTKGGGGPAFRKRKGKSKSMGGRKNPPPGGCLQD